MRRHVETASDTALSLETHCRYDGDSVSGSSSLEPLSHLPLTCGARRAGCAAGRACVMPRISASTVREHHELQHGDALPVLPSGGVS